MISKHPGFRYGALGALMLAVVGCTAIPKTDAPAPVPQPVAPAPTPAPLPTPSKGWEDRAVDAGAWRYDAGSRSAAFVPTGSANPLLTMTCSNDTIRMTSALIGNVSLRTSAGTDQIRFDSGSASLGNRDTRLDRTVAVKVLPGAFAADSEARRRLEQEARVIAALNDSHICTIHDVGRHGELDYLVLEFLEGETLEERLTVRTAPASCTAT
jgi:serine/threonine protein kinase